MHQGDPGTEASRLRALQPTPGAAVYVGSVTLLALVGFVRQSPWPVLVAAALALPVSLVAVPCYYLVYGLLAQVPGANPTSVTGSGTVGPDGVTTSSASAGTAAAWFTVTTHLVGILALALSAALSVLLVRAARGRPKPAARTTLGQ